MAEAWLKCSACRNPIPFNAAHWVCSVSTCNRARTRLVFCTVPCWDSHVAMLLDEAVYHAEHLHLGARDTPGLDIQVS